MARNVEIKASVDNWSALADRADALADGEATIIDQDDTFFHCDRGRLKLRDFGDGTAELIYYQRPDQAGPKTCHYEIAAVDCPKKLRTVLEMAHGILGRVRKTRRLYLVGRTRIHLDRVEGLGDFMELEVVLDETESTRDGQLEAERLMQQLDIRPDALIQGAYLDLLLNPD